jgi:hypothetical protein
MRCSSCGAEASGKFCSDCGAPVSGGKSGCSKCGHELKPGEAFCSNCGQPAAPRAAKPLSAHLPWVLSFVALAAFAFLIAWFVQQQSRARIGDDPITGGLPEPSAAEGAPGAGAGAGGMPDLASMSPREAADRLFDRSMREQEAGNEGQASQFANMALQAYGQVPPDQIDLDGLFHVGLLHLLMGDSNTATSIAESILADDESHLLALLLGRRAAVAVGDMAAADAYRERLRTAVDAGLIEEAGRPEYQAHRGLIEREAGVAPAEGSSGDGAGGDGSD